MSIKDLFNRKQALFENATSASAKVESSDFVKTKIKQKNEFIPNVDFSTASNFAQFGSAKI